ncbi:MAG: hypothetical protein IT377_07280 [Polyangiaceae bacterium]|nr:hypothetical protein [Polyangiaceae bacterium]
MTTYTMEVREYCAFDLKVSAESKAEAIEKAKAFYASYRLPATRYQEDGLTAELSGHSIRYARRSSTGQSGWARKTRPAARETAHRDAPETVA